MSTVYPAALLSRKCLLPWAAIPQCSTRGLCAASASCSHALPLLSAGPHTGPLAWAETRALPGYLPDPQMGPDPQGCPHRALWRTFPVDPWRPCLAVLWSRRLSPPQRSPPLVACCKVATKHPLVLRMQTACGAWLGVVGMLRRSGVNECLSPPACGLAPRCSQFLPVRSAILGWEMSASVPKLVTAQLADRHLSARPPPLSFTEAEHH